MKYNKFNNNINEEEKIENVEVITPTIAIYKNQEFEIVEQIEDEILLKSLDNNNPFVQWYKINAVQIQK